MLKSMILCNIMLIHTCHNALDRDYNASENIMLEGLKQYMKKSKYG